MYNVTVEILDIHNGKRTLILMERFYNISDAEREYRKRVLKHCFNRDLTVEYDVYLNEIDNDGIKEILYRTICK